MDKPVFIYDHFGGPGFLNDTNFDSVAHYTFSGRTEIIDQSLVHSLQQTRNRLSARQIVKQLEAGYADAVQFHKNNRAKFICNYSVDKVFPVLLNIAAQNHAKEILSEHYQNYILHTQLMIADYVVSNQHLANPTSEFYRQRIQLFYSTDETFTEQDSSFCAPLQENVSLTLSSQYTNYRIDFGELPCLVYIDTTQCISINSNATVSSNRWYLFTNHDPQFHLVIDTMKSVTVTARIFPIFNIPTEQSIHFANSLKTQLLNGQIAQRRWDKLMSNTIFFNLYKLYQRFTSK